MFEMHLSVVSDLKLKNFSRDVLDFNDVSCVEKRMFIFLVFFVFYAPFSNWLLQYLEDAEMTSKLEKKKDATYEKFRQQNVFATLAKR